MPLVNTSSFGTWRARWRDLCSRSSWPILNLIVDSSSCHPSSQNGGVLLKNFFHHPACQIGAQSTHELTAVLRQTSSFVSQRASRSASSIAAVVRVKRSKALTSGVRQHAAAEQGRLRCFQISTPPQAPCYRPSQASEGAHSDQYRHNVSFFAASSSCTVPPLYQLLV